MASNLKIHAGGSIATANLKTLNLNPKRFEVHNKKTLLSKV